MNTAPEVNATPWEESGGTCACCGRTSKTIWGDLSTTDAALATYFVQWTAGAPEHDVNLDLVIGAWGEGTGSNDRFLVSVLYRPASGGGSFMVVDGDTRLSSKRDLCGRAMKRAEVVGTPLASEVFSLLDALWLTDPRIAQDKALDNAG